jgi:hypothetical protein
MIQILIAIDQLLNTFVWLPQDGWGYADETLSVRAFRCHLQGGLGTVLGALAGSGYVTNKLTAPKETK